MPISGADELLTVRDLEAGYGRNPDDLVALLLAHLAG